jgi:thioredoxin reductase (NADPH)
MQSPQTDVAVIGAGPIGIELAVALKRAGVDYLQFDAKQIGYTISWFAPQTRFFSSNERIAIAGVPLFTADQSKASREEYLAYLRGVVGQFDLKINTYEPIVGIARDENGFTLTSQPPGGSRRSYRAKRIVLATGGTDHPRHLNIPGEALPHVSHYFRDPHIYFDKRVLIIGGKNSAVEAALRCYNVGAHVALSYRRAELPEKSIKYWLLPEIKSLFKSGRIEAYFQSIPLAITPTHVTLQRGGAERFDVPADFVLALVGYQQDQTLFKLAGVELRGDEQSPMFDEQTMETNVPGIYVAGTAVGGTQDKFRVFIENCHVHVDRILAAVTGARAPAEAREYAEPET